MTSRDDPLLAQWQYGLGRSVAWTSDSTGRWARDWLGWDGFSKFFSQLVSWTFPGEETGGIEASFDGSGETTRLHVESVEPDGSPRDFYTTSAVLVGPDLEPRQVSLVQIAPGVYEAPLGSVDPGAYAVRITQARPGSSPLGRTVGLVAPTAAEYRSLGTNEPFLAAVRTATGGRVVETPADPWIHDLRQTSRFAELWPLLLLLALLLWPLDIALRRVSVGRREFAAAGAWVRGLGGRRARVAARTPQHEGMLAARERATSTSTRAAMRATSADGATADAGTVAPAEAPTARTDPPATPDATGSAPMATTTADTADTMARLRDAKRRARER